MNHLFVRGRGFSLLPLLFLGICGMGRADPGISPDEGLLSYWKFENTTSDVARLFDSVTGFSDDDLTPQGGAARYVPGVVGQALAIGDQGGDPLWLNAPDSEDVDLPATYTIEAWIYPTVLDETWQRLVLRWEGGFSYHFALRLFNGQWTVSLFHQEEFGGQPNANGGIVVPNEWQHIAGVADGSMLRVYLNGQEVDAVPYDGTITRGTGVGLGLGDMTNGNGLRYNGYVDELAIWNIPLTAEEILSHYEAGGDGYGLQLFCEEEFDGVVISGPNTAAAGGTVELTAEMTGLDPGQTAAFSWELVSGVADLGPTNTETLEVTPADPGTVVVRVEAGDGLCEDLASAIHTISVLPSGNPGISPDEGLISYWSFDDVISDDAVAFTNHSGTTNDHLTARGGVARFVSGVVGKALAIGEKAGDALWLDAPDSADVDLPATYTIEAWIYPTELSDSWQRLVLRWGGAVGPTGNHSYHFAIRNNGGFTNGVSLFHGQADGGEPNANGGTVVPNTWQHIAGVADGSTLRVYLNGQEVDAVPYDGTILDGSGEGLGIADSATALSTIRYNGYLDELAIWNLPLTEDEILSHYEAGTAGYGLDVGCIEDRDSVTISGPTLGTVGQEVELTANMEGVDAGAAAAYSWELVSGSADLGPTDQATLKITGNDVGRVVVQVSAGDGRCEDFASAQAVVNFFSGQEGLSPDRGLVSYWAFEDSLADDGASFPIHSGMVDDILTAQQGNARFVPGIVGKGVAIGDEPDDPLWLNAPDSADVDLPATYTIEAWVYPTVLDETWQRLVLRWGVEQSYHFALRLVGGSWMVSTIHHQAGDPLQTFIAADGGNVELRRWQHIAGVADGRDLITYLDGEEVARTPYDGTITQGSGVGLGIGDMDVGNGLRFNGYLDELAIWNVPLTAGHIRSHYRAGPEGYGLSAGCGEETDRVTITGPILGTLGQDVELTAVLEGLDPGAQATYSWELVSGIASLGPTDGETLTISSPDVGAVTVRVSAGDGVCEDSATALHTVSFFTGDPGFSPDEGLVSYWDFDATTEDNASLFDSNVGFVLDHLTAQGGQMRLVDGIVGSALALGVEPEDALWLDAPDSEDVDLPEIYTIEAWIYPTELTDTWQRLVLRWGAFGSSYHFAIRNEGVDSDGNPNENAVSLFHGQLGGLAVNANGGTVALAQWQHLAGVADGEFIRVYLNGREVNAVPYDGTILRGTGEGLGVGDSFSSLTTIRYNGYLDELAIWNLPLSADELLSHYEAGPGGYGLEGGQPLPPNPPENLAALAGDETVDLSWDEPSPGPSFTGYSVLRDGASIAENLPTTQLTYSDTGLANGTRYCYVVRAARGALRSEDSNEACATPVGEGPIFKRGDADGNGSLELTDVIRALTFQFVGGVDINCLDAADVDDDGAITLTDSIRSLNFQFVGVPGTMPEPPGPVECGPDVEVDAFPPCQYPPEHCGQ